ncbi:MAG: hypothetical protein AAF385_01965, partial [Pseudomonadota bacterium]
MTTLTTKALAKVLIAGSGYSGSALLQTLRAQGINALGASRNPPAGPQHIALDLDADFDPLPASIRSIVFLVPPASGQPEPRLQRLLSKLSSTPERIVLASTSGVYGDCAGELVDENRSTAPLTERATRRVEQENTLLNFCRGKAVRAVILRIAGIYAQDLLGCRDVAVHGHVVYEYDPAGLEDASAQAGAGRRRQGKSGLVGGRRQHCAASCRGDS